METSASSLVRSELRLSRPRGLVKYKKGWYTIPMNNIDKKLAFNLVDSKIYQAIGIIKEAHSFITAADVEDELKEYLTQMLNFPYESLHELSSSLVYDFYPEHDGEIPND